MGGITGAGGTTTGIGWIGVASIDDGWIGVDSTGVDSIGVSAWSSATGVSGPDHPKTSSVSETGSPAYASVCASVCAWGAVTIWAAPQWGQKSAHAATCRVQAGHCIYSLLRGEVIDRPVSPGGRTDAISGQGFSQSTVTEQDPLGPEQVTVTVGKLL